VVSSRLWLKLNDGRYLLQLLGGVNRINAEVEKEELIIFWFEMNILLRNG